MNVFDKARVVVYRFHEKGLEIFLVNNELKNDPSVWKIPNGKLSGDMLNFSSDEELIELEGVDHDGNPMRTIAIEGDWHNIPSIRGLIKHDVKLAKSTIKELMPGIEKGAFFVVKDAVKKVMPNEYKSLKELKDILMDRNLLKYL